MNIPSQITDFIKHLTYVREKLFGMKPSPLKLQLIDRALGKNRISSFADLGGVWGIHGAYTFYILSRRNIGEAYLVDNYFTKEVMQRKQRYPQLQLVRGDLRVHDTFEKIGNVDVMLLFDILLHQVNWKDVLSFCAEKSDALAIYNPQFYGEKSVRLLDLGEEEYFRVVPHQKKGLYYEDLFTPRMDPDTPGVWQWGICDDDLIATLKALGFDLVYGFDGESWVTGAFKSKGFLFKKDRTDSVS